MEKIKSFKNTLANAVSFPFLAASYELKLGEYILFDIPHQNTLVALILFATARGITPKLAGLALRCAAIKRWVLGPYNVVGHWLVYTEPKGNKDDSILLEPTLLDMRFDSQTGEFKVDAYRYCCGREHITKSKLASVKRNGQMRYLNYFEVETSDQGHKHGHAYGKFTNEAGELPRTLTATISLEGEDVQRLQRGSRVEVWKVKAFKKKFGSRNWKEKFLETSGQIVDGQPIDAVEKALLETLKNPASAAKEKTVALSELENHRAEIMSKRQVSILSKWSRRRSA